MKFSAKNLSLIQALKPVVQCADTGAKKDYPDEGKITLVTDQNGLTAMAHNGFVAISAKITPTQIEGKITDPGTVTVKAGELFKSLNTYPTDEALHVAVENNELTIRADSDAEQLQTMRVVSPHVQMPAPPKSYDKEVSIKRSLFIEASKKVLFAIGVEKFKPEFLYWIMRVKPDFVRTVSGDGSRFAVYQAEGPNLCNATKQLDICVHFEQSNTLIQILDMFGDDMITLREHAATKDEDELANQTVIETSSVSITLVGHNPGIKWPNEDKFVNRQNAIRYVTRVSDWKFAVSGMDVTKNKAVKDSHEVHTASVTFVSAKNAVKISSEHDMRSQRSLKFLDSSGSPDSFSFNCSAEFIHDVFAKGESDDYVQFEFVNDKAPAVVRYYGCDRVSDAPLCKVNKTTGVKEQYLMFFASTNKK